MITARFTALTVLVSALSAAPPGATPQAPANPAPQAAGNTAPQAVLDRYCVTCHSDRTRAGGLALEKRTVADASSDPQIWEKVIRKVETGMMPPSGAPRPERASLDGLATAAAQSIDRAAAVAPNPGAPALHRLNRGEYANAIRDLLDLPIDPTTMLPGDDSSEGFDNMASVLSVSPALMQAYVSAAAKISRLAVGDLTTTATIATYQAPRGLAQSAHREGMPLGTRGGILVEHVFPLDAEYELRVGRGGAGFGLSAVGAEEPVEITLDGQRVRLIGRDAPRAEGPLRISAGPHTIGVAVVRKTNSYGVDDLFSELAISSGIQSLTINGPLNPTGPGDTPSRRRIFSCRPARPQDEAPCARKILSSLATRAWRRPVSASDTTVDTLLEFFDSGRKLRGFDTGIQYALARVLVDPQFIYRFERAPGGVRPGAAYRISNLELASRLSFFLWSSIPDEDLLQVAAAGRLVEPKVLEQQTRRMLSDPRAGALIDNIAGQWLLLRELEDIAPGTKEFDGNLRYSFKRETELLFETIVREDRSVLDLIDADYTFVDERLARHYGIPDIRGSRFRRVTLAGDERRGLLGHGSLLTVTSAGDRTSPVKRGKWILENLMGAPVPSPPTDVDTTLNETATAGAKPLSVRQRLERHRANPACASCHAIMDPIGFSLENYDLIGHWRASDGGVPVNTEGRLPDGTALSGPASVRRALLDRREAVAATATEKLLTYALGRRLEYYDMPAVRKIVRAAAADNYRFSSLVDGVVRSTPFQMKRFEGGTEP